LRQRTLLKASVWKGHPVFKEDKNNIMVCMGAAAVIKKIFYGSVFVCFIESPVHGFTGYDGIHVQATCHPVHINVARMIIVLLLFTIVILCRWSKYSFWFKPLLDADFCVVVLLMTL
jgi:hypothetical protein